MAGLTPEALDELEALGGIYGDAFLAFPAEARCQARGALRGHRWWPLGALIRPARAPSQLSLPATLPPQVSVELGRGRELLARFLLPPGYPQAAPPFAELEARPRGAVGAEELEAASARLERAWEDGGREVALFAYVEWLRETFAQGDPEPEAEAVRRGRRGTGYRGKPLVPARRNCAARFLFKWRGVARGRETRALLAAASSGSNSGGSHSGRRRDQ